MPPTTGPFHFAPGSGLLPVLEGKQIQPFAVTSIACIVSRSSGGGRLLGPETFARPRLAYRDVASASNRVTLIAAMPANVVTTHTLFCLKHAVDRDVQLFLCGVFNSFVANYLVRMRVGTARERVDHRSAPGASPSDRFFRVRRASSR